MAQNQVYRIPKTGLGPSGWVKSTEAAPVPKAHEVLVRIQAASLNYRDFMIASGIYPFPQKDNVVPCSDMAGDIVSVGEGVTGFKVGDRVTGSFDQTHLYGPMKDWNGGLGGPQDGTLQQYRVFNPTGLLHLPAHLSYEEGSCLPCTGVTAWNALYGGAPLVPGQTVLFQGTGGVSMTGLMLAHAAGAKTIITSSSDAKLELAKKLGATHTINYKTNPEWEKKVLEITNGEGAHHIFDNVGITQIEKCFTAVAPGGNISCIGFLGGAPKEVPNVCALALGKGASLRGINIGPKQMFDDLIRFVEAKQLKPLIDRVFPFDQAVQALEYLASGQHSGKIVIKVAA